MFFGWFWTHGGQTLGMRVAIKLLTAGGQAVDWRQSIVRTAGAHLSLFAAGLGYLWILVDRDRLARHDRLSRTRLVMIEKRWPRTPRIIQRPMARNAAAGTNALITGLKSYTTAT